MKQKYLTQMISGIVGLAGVSFFPHVVIAEEKKGADPIEEVVVTGSRIVRTGGDAMGPVTIISSDFIEQTGSVGTEEILAKLPAISKNATNANDANGGKGTHFTEIHNLGESRVLVLVNGRRFVSTILGSDLAVDLNNIPSKMIDRVEVLADGASALYGSDAVAGVVNLILKDSIDQPLIEIGGGMTTEGDRETFELSGSLGGSLGERGSYIAGFSYTDRKGITMQDRDWSSTPILLNNSDGTQLMGSGIPPEGRFSANGTGYIFVPNGGASYEEYKTYDSSKGHRFNYNAGERPADLVSPVSNLNFFSSADYELSDKLKAFVEGSYASRDGSYQMMGLPISGSHGKYTDMIPVSLSNPNIPTDALALLNSDSDIASAGQFNMTWRSQDLGQRFFEWEGTTYSITAGLEGEISNWNWTTYIGQGSSVLDEVTNNQVNVTALRTAVNPTACGADPACQSAFSSTGGAIDIFGRNPNFTDAQKNYVLFNDAERTEYTQTQAAFSISNGEILEFAHGGVGVAAGLEYRDESGERTVSEITRNGDSGGNFAEPTSGSYDVVEAYVETSIMLVEGLEGAEELSLSLAARYSDYSTFGSKITRKAGLNYAPAPGISFRGAVSSAFRAPNVMELYGGTSDDYEAVSDPCNNYGSNKDIDVITKENCIADGIPANYAQDAGQLRLSKGGNEELEAETADTKTFGVVFDKIENLVFTVDYFNVEVNGAIGEPGSQDVIQRCYTTPGLDNSECARITRNAEGRITSFNLLKENLDKITSRGIDYSLSYTFQAGSGDVGLTWLGSKMLEYSETTRDGVKTNLEGKVFCSSCSYGMYPEFRSTTQISYTMDNWGVALTHRYLPSMKVEALYGAADFNHGTNSEKIEYYDISGYWENDSFKVSLGAENLTNEDPYTIPDVSNNTSDGYDWLGTYVYTRLQYKF